jgi:hypothetical protein
MPGLAEFGDQQAVEVVPVTGLQIEKPKQGTFWRTGAVRGG